MAGADHALIVDAVIEGTAPGWIRVDDGAGPRQALVSTPEGHYAIGCPDNERFNAALRALITEQIIPQGKAAGWGALVLHYWPDTWRQRLRAMLPRADTKEDFQHFFRFTTPRVRWQDRIPDGFAMRRVDASILARRELRNIDHARRWAQSNFGSIVRYLANGFGFGLLHNDVLVSWCIADAVNANRCEIGIHTDEGYRRRGLATLTVAATIDYCLTRGLTEIGWHCWSENRASAATARRAGFAYVMDHHAFWVRL